MPVDDAPPRDEAPSPAARRPWDLHPALTEERLAAAARLLVRGRADALAMADPWAGDDAWSVGCRAYSFSRHQLRRAAAGALPGASGRAPAARGRVLLGRFATSSSPCGSRPFG